MGARFIWPIADPVITRGFGYLSSLYVGGMHAAIDLTRKTGTTRGAPIKAVADGTVVCVDYDDPSGHYVSIDHAGCWRSSYRHLIERPPMIVGELVGQGQVIGNVGNTGWSQGDHLHFDLWNREKVRDDGAIFYKNGWYAIDPALYLGQEDDMGMTDTEKAAFDALVAWQRAHATLLRDASTTAAFRIEGRMHRLVRPEVWEAMGRDAAEVVEVPHSYIVERAPVRGPDVTMEEARGGTPVAGPTLREIADGLKIEVR